MPDFHFDVVRESELWDTDKMLRRAVGKVAGLLGERVVGTATYVFSDDSMVHVLNREWRGKDKATNVLSFPDGDPDENGVVHLGDVIVAHETVAREAVEMGIPFDDHLTHLLLHGTLHLLGYDHETDEQAKTMENLETTLLASVGIKDPYQSGNGALD